MGLAGTSLNLAPEVSEAVNSHLSVPGSSVSWDDPLIGSVPSSGNVATDRIGLTRTGNRKHRSSPPIISPHSLESVDPLGPWRNLQVVDPLLGFEYAEEGGEGITARPRFSLGWRRGDAEKRGQESGVDGEVLGGMVAGRGGEGGRREEGEGFAL
jgi:hypothetical protein